MSNLTYKDIKIQDNARYSDKTPLTKVIEWIEAGGCTVTERLCRTVCEAIYTQIDPKGHVILNEEYSSLRRGKLLHRQIEAGERYITTAKTWRELTVKFVQDFRFHDYLDKTTVIKHIPYI